MYIQRSPKAEIVMIPKCIHCLCPMVYTSFFMWSTIPPGITPVYGYTCSRKGCGGNFAEQHARHIDKMMERRASEVKPSKKDEVFLKRARIKW